jgi:hypothetical protein
MRLPSQAVTVARSHNAGPFPGSVRASGCSVFKKVTCAGAIIACGGVCVGSLGAACVQCLAAIGASGCIDCF